MTGPRYDTDEAPVDSTAAERVRYALQQIEGAQNLLSAACANLSPVIGWVREWEAVHKLARRVKATWYKLDGKKRVQEEKMRLDGEVRR